MFLRYVIIEFSMEKISLSQGLGQGNLKKQMADIDSGVGIGDI